MANYTGMIALIPDNPGQLAVPGGDPASEMHLTLAYFGSDPDIVTDRHRQMLGEAVQRLANDWAPVVAKVFAHSVWNVDSDEPATVYEMSGDNSVLENYAATAQMYGRDAFGVLMPEPYRVFKPHVTAGYGISPELLTYKGDVQFSKIRLVLGDDLTEFPLIGRTWQMEGNQGGYADAVRAIRAAGEPRVPVEFPTLVVEGLATGDGRFIRPGALKHRALPLHVLAQTQNPVNGKGHDGAYVVGQLDTLERVPGPEVVSRETGEPFPEGTFVWKATGWVNPNVQGADLVVGSFNEETGKWEGGVLSGNSVDLIEVEASFEYAEDAQPDDGPSQVVIEDGTIAATTLCAVPAFAESYVLVDGAQAATVEALAASVLALPAFRSADIGDDNCLPCMGVVDDEFAVSQEKRDRAEDKGAAMPGGRYPIENEADLKKAIQAVGRAGGPQGSEKDRDAVRRHITKRAKALGLEKLLPSTWKGDGKLNPAGKGMKASVDAGHPPLAAFLDPQLDGPTPLTIDDSEAGFGYLRVFGHLATWGTCHTGFAGQCVTPPRSASDYAYFNVGAVRATDDTGQLREVAVGHITMGEGGHAGLELSASDAAAYYDNVNTVVADVAAGEDAHGVWFAGVVRRTATPEQVDVLRASPLSGDWRPYGGSLELVAALAVNSPGFPVPRVRVASGAPVALVAAGVVPPTPEPNKPATGTLELDYDRLATAIAAKLNPVPAPATLGEEVAAAFAEFDAELADLERWSAQLLFDVDEAATGELAKNWVDKAGGLPKYIKRISKHLRAKGMDESRAIATAVNAAKKMCATGDINFPGKQNVNPGSKAEACAAVADWERKKASARAD